MGDGDGITISDDTRKAVLMVNYPRISTNLYPANNDTGGHTEPPQQVESLQQAGSDDDIWSDSSSSASDTSSTSSSNMFDPTGVSYDAYGNVVIAPSTIHQPPATDQQPAVVPEASSAVITTLPKELQSRIETLAIERDARGMLGIHLKRYHKKLFVSMVKKESPADKAGVCFGDVVLEIEGKSMTGRSGSWAMQLIHKQKSKMVRIKLHARAYQAMIRGKITGDNIQLSNTNGYQLLDTSIKKLASAKSFKSSRIVAIGRYLMIGENRDQYLRYLRLFRAHEWFPIFVMPTGLYRRIVGDTSRSYLKQHMANSWKNALELVFSNQQTA